MEAAPVEAPCGCGDAAPMMEGSVMESSPVSSEGFDLAPGETLVPGSVSTGEAAAAPAAEAAPEMAPSAGDAVPSSSDEAPAAPAADAAADAAEEAAPPAPPAPTPDANTDI